MHCDNEAVGSCCPFGRENDAHFVGRAGGDAQPCVREDRLPAWLRFAAPTRPLNANVGHRTKRRAARSPAPPPPATPHPELLRAAQRAAAASPERPGAGVARPSAAWTCRSG